MTAPAPSATWITTLDPDLDPLARPDGIRLAVKDCLDAGRGNGGHILTASNAITDSVPVANYAAAVNAYRDYFGLSRVRL